MIAPPPTHRRLDGRVSFVGADGKRWIVHAVIERAYCLHARRGILADFAVAHQDEVLPMPSLEPCGSITVRPHPFPALSDEIVTGCFARLLYVSGPGCGGWMAEPLTGPSVIGRRGRSKRPARGMAL